jgi:hypothetical protein
MGARIMDTSTSIAHGRRNVTPFATLRRFAVARTEPVLERCDLCSIGLPPEHRHLLELATHKILCSCDACGLRFENVLDGKFKLIPRDVRSLPGFQLSDAQWEDLALPIDLAFLFYSTPAKRMMALYPSPAGATESLLSLAAWDSLVAENPALAGMQPDVEALLVNRVGERRLYYLAPIDVCFELVGLMRTHWRGLSGGEEVWREIEAFYTRLAEKAQPFLSFQAKEANHA